MSDVKRQVVTGTVAASPEQVFAVVSHPAGHVAIDGAGMLVNAPDSPAPVGAVGETFLMDMNAPTVGEYRMRNHVIALESDRCIAWEPRLEAMTQGIADLLGDIDPFGYHFRFDLEPTADGQTAVTHSYDWNGVQDERALALFPVISTEQMAETVARLADVVAKGGV